MNRKGGNNSTGKKRRCGFEKFISRRNLMTKLTSIGDLPITLSVEDVASYLGISRVGAYNLCHSKGFPSMRIGKRILIPRDHFFAWLDKRQKEAIE
jgi:excisionase family DNA binding protein